MEEERNQSLSYQCHCGYSHHRHTSCIAALGTAATNSAGSGRECFYHTAKYSSPCLWWSCSFRSTLSNPLLTSFSLRKKFRHDMHMHALLILHHMHNVAAISLFFLSLALCFQHAHLGLPWERLPRGCWQDGSCWLSSPYTDTGG